MAMASPCLSCNISMGKGCWWQKHHCLSPCQVRYTRKHLLVCELLGDRHRAHQIFRLQSQQYSFINPHRMLVGSFCYSTWDLGSSLFFHLLSMYSEILFNSLPSDNSFVLHLMSLIVTYRILLVLGQLIHRRGIQKYIPDQEENQSSLLMVLFDF